MLKGRDDIDRVLEIARRYDVKVYLHPLFPRGFQELWHERVSGPLYQRGLKIMDLTPTSSDGPIWHSCDVKKKIVWFHNFDHTEPETHLHEIIHCITQPPGGDIEQLSEDVVLMPLERILARQCLSPKAYKRVVAWQEGTAIEWWDARNDCYYRMLTDAANYTRMWYWRQSYKQLRRMGAIKNGRVTWRPLNWKRASRELMQRGNWYEPDSEEVGST